MIPLLLLLFSATAVAAVDGTVINKTTNQPQAGVAVTLIQPSQAGMKTLGTATSDAQGKFQIAGEPAGPGPQLVQALYRDVTYNRLITPGVPTSGLEVNVFESSAKPGSAQVAQHMVLLQPSASQLQVAETIIYHNDGTHTYNDPKEGTLRFFLPPSANGIVRINVTGPQGMAIPRPAEKTKQVSVYKVSFPVKPGETRFDLTYVLPAGGFSSRILHTEGATRLVVPNGVALSGDKIVPLGQEPSTKAGIYDVKGAGDYKVSIQGTGTLGTPETAVDEDNPAPEVRQALPRIYENKKLYWILGLVLAILTLGLVILYRK